MHLYAQDGSPVYEVPYADPRKGMRPATLRDAKKHGYLPSVTEVMRVMAAPGLENWKQRQVLMAALTLPRQDGWDDDRYMSEIMKDSQEQAKKAAEKGTAIHDALEAVFRGRIISPQYLSLAIGVKTKVCGYFEEIEWEAEKSFAHPMGYGGKVDLHSPRVLIDFKTKERFEDGKRLVWDNHLIQLEAYRRGLGLPDDTRLANVFVDYDGHVVLHDWKSEAHDWDAERERAWGMFQAMLTLWQLEKRYDSSF